MEQRSAIKFCVRLGKSFADTHAMIRHGFGDEALSRTTVFTWWKRFKEGRETLEDDERCGRPATAVHNENVTKVRTLLLSQPHLTVRALAEELRIGKDAVRTILTQRMNRRKVCARFVPHMLTDEQKQIRLSCYQDFIETADSDSNFLKTIVTGDESWCFMYDPQTKRQSSAWLSPGEQRPTKVRQQKSKVKTMLIAFFDSKGLIHHEFVPVGQTVNARFYLEVMKRLVHRIRRIRPEYKDPGSWTLLHDNAPAHTATLLTHYYAANQITVLSHPPYSPDLAPADFFLFPKVKLKMKGHFFQTVQAIQSACTEQLKAIPQRSYSNAFEGLYRRCKECVAREGYYVEG